ncbi:MAG: hypothetical protein OZ921_21500 [Sorangiineae bacterium]|nr:hypothetical protein [Polyangiaceae bacterium]MEB2325104.1 hypothetical protein [Sorangiineae bacterium]
MTWRIERLVPGGDGFTRLPDGRAGFATGALPGDVILPERVEDHRSYLRATSFRLVEPSPERVEPACPIADACGGCDLIRLSREAELREKSAMLGEALRRTGGFRDLPAPHPIITAGSELGYRSRIRVRVDAEGRVGYFARGTHELVELERCAVATPEVNQALAELRERARSSRVEPGELELRATPGEARVSLPEGVELYAPADAFAQVNAAVNERIIVDLLAGARERGLTTFCDLFAGAGNFALPLARAGLRGVAIERTGSAIEAGRRAASAQGLAVRFVAGDVARSLARERGPFELAVLDPPRAGAREVLAPLVRLRPRSIAYLACDIVTLARDLSALTRSGYALERVTGYDMFPRTHHLEALAWLARA